MSLKHATTYKKYGFSIIPTDEGKRPCIPSWKPYQQAIATDDELKQMFSSARAKGLAVICGAVSGNLEVIDVDCKYDVTGTLFEDYMQLIVDASPELADKLLVAKTTNGGYHLYYRCKVIDGNKKLASRPAIREEQEDNPHEKVKVLIETRGEGGYVVAAPTAGYKFQNERRPADCPMISEEERELLLEAARSMNQWHEKPVTPTLPDDKNYSVKPGDDYNKRGDMVALLERHGWRVVRDTADKVVFKRPGNTDSKTSGDFNKKLGWFSVFTTSSVFEPNKAYTPFAVYAKLECGDNYTEAAKRLLNEGYGRVRKKIDKRIESYIRAARSEGADDKAILETLRLTHGLSPEQSEESLKDFNANSGGQFSTFWEVEVTAKGGRKIHIVRTKLEQFLTQEGGFYLYFYDPNSKIFKIVQNHNGLIEEASTEQVKKFIKNYILSLPGSFDDITREDLLEAVYRGGNTYFSDAFFEFIEPAQIDFLKDTAQVAYFPFRNGVVCVDKDGYELRTYGELKKSIWHSQVIDFPIELYDIQSLPDVEYYRFIEKVCGGDPHRIKYCVSIIGYLLHKHKDPTTPYCIILAEETEDEKKGGGTGKGIFVKALARMINVEEVDGKNFKLDKNFAFQRVKLDTRLVAIQDVRKNVDFEGFYSIITEGITIEKKNKDELYIPYADSPKIMFTTNYTIPGSSNHARRRQKVVEFSQFFNPENTPLDYFQHRIFDDWDADQWLRFYNFMFHCVRYYLQNGIPEMESTATVRRKQIKLQFGEDFYGWWTDFADNMSGQWHQFSSLYSGFLSQNDLDKKDYSQKRFKKGIEEAASIFGFVLEDRRNRQNNNRHEVFLSKDRVQSVQNEYTETDTPF